MDSKSEKKAQNLMVKKESPKRSKKLISFFVNFFGKKTKKSFSSVISHLLDDYEKAGLIGLEERKMFKNMTSFGDKKVAAIMTPRSDIIAVKHDASLEDLKKIITNDGHTRLPVFRDNFDEIIGFVHSKDLAKFLCRENADFLLTEILRKILFVPGSMRLVELMLRMRTSRTHVAIVLDEFGGVDGFVTIENLVEEIFGNIEDEHDLPSDNSFFRIKKIDSKTLHFGGRVEIEKFEEILQKSVRADGDQFETVAGFVMHLFKRVPEIGAEVKKSGLKFKIIDADERLVKMVEVVIIG